MSDSLDLSFATVDELYEELRRRHEGIVMVLEKPGPEGDTENYTGFYYDGGLSRAIGMCARLHDRLLREAREGPEHQD